MRGLWIVAVMAAIGASSAGFAKQGATPPRGNPARFFGPEAYPVEAIRLAQQGRVIARLWIDATGKVASCTIHQSSGSQSLDKATCDIALGQVTYRPALDDRGAPIASEVTLPVRWALPIGPTDVDAVPVPPVFASDVTFSVDSNGIVQACNGTMEPEPPAGRGPCDRYAIGSQTDYRWTRSGRPVGGTIVQKMRMEVTIDP